MTFQLYSAHGHKRKETYIFLVLLISSPPYSFLSLSFPSLSLHLFWLLCTSPPFSFLHSSPHPLPKAAHPFSSLFPSSSTPPTPSRVLPIPPSLFFFPLAFSPLISLGSSILHPLSFLSTFPFPFCPSQKMLQFSVLG